MRDLAAELVGRPGLALADALDLGRVQGIDLGAALAMILVAHLDGEIEQRAEARLELGIAVDLAADVADEAAEPGAQELERPAGPLELMGVGVAPDHDGGALGHPQIALAQRHALALGERHQLLDRPVHEPRVGRMRDRLGLHRGVHHHPLQVLGLDRAGLVRHRQALLEQGHELLLAQALAPARQRRAVEGQLVAEALLAAEVLVIGVLDPARAQHLVRQVCMCFRMNRPATSRVGSAGWPGPASHTEPKRPSRNSQSISPASRTSGWPMSMI